MAKKKNELSFEEKLENALVPEEEQPYEIPENWVWTRLGEVFEWGSGGTPSRKEKENFEGKIPWFKTGELNNEHLYNSEERITQRALDNSSAKLYPPNTVIMAMYGATIGKLGILSVDGTTNQACACAKPNKYVLVKYLFFYLMSRREDFIKKGKGGAQPNISLEIIKDYKFPLPPFQEQQRIIERIESLFSKLDEAKEKIQMALDSFETRKSAILYQAFSGELTQKWREENGRSLDDWEEIVLKDTLQNMTSKRPSGEYFCYIDIDSIDNHKQKVREPKMLETLKAPSRASRETLENDTLFSMVRPYLKNIAFIDRSLSGCIASTGFYVCRPNDKIYPKYLYLLLCSSDTINYTMKFMKGDNSPSIRKADLENMPVNMPSILEQKEIVCILDTIFDKEQDTQELIDLIETIDLMKKSILARAFRGELGTNIPEEESAIELLKLVLEV